MDSRQRTASLFFAHELGAETEIKAKGTMLVIKRKKPGFLEFFKQYGTGIKLVVSSLDGVIVIIAFISGCLCSIYNAYYQPSFFKENYSSEQYK